MEVPKYRTKKQPKNVDKILFSRTHKLFPGELARSVTPKPTTLSAFEQIENVTEVVLTAEMAIREILAAIHCC